MNKNGKDPEAKANKNKKIRDKIQQTCYKERKLGGECIKYASLVNCHNEMLIKCVAINP